MKTGLGLFVSFVLATMFLTYGVLLLVSPRTFLRLYDFVNMARRTMDYILTRGGQVKEKLYLNRGDVKIGWRVLRDCILIASSRRRRFTLSLLAQTLAFRPSAIKEAITVAVLHKHFYEYMQDVCRQLEVHLEAGAPAPTRA